MTPVIFLAVAAGGAVGAMGRYLISTVVQNATNSNFAYGTLTVNVLGSFIIGMLAVYFGQVVAPAHKAFFITGMLGALTTFSTFSLESVTMLQDGLYARALTSVSLNVALCLMATIGGMILFKKVFGF